MCGRISRLEEQISCRDRIYRECSKAAISVLEGEGKYNNVGELRYLVSYYKILLCQSGPTRTDRCRGR